MSAETHSEMPPAAELEVVARRHPGRPEELIRRIRLLLFLIAISLLAGATAALLAIPSLSSTDKATASGVLAVMAIAWTYSLIRGRTLWRDLVFDVAMLAALGISTGQVLAVGSAFYAAAVFRSTYRGRSISIIRPIAYSATFVIAGYIGAELSGGDLRLPRLLTEAAILSVTALMVTSMGRLAEAHQLHRRHESTLLAFAADIAGENDLDRIARIGTSTVAEIVRYGATGPSEVIFGARSGHSVVIRSGRGRSMSRSYGDLAERLDLDSPELDASQMAEDCSEMLLATGEHLIYCGSARQMRRTAFPIGVPGDWLGLILVLTCEELPEISKSSISMVVTNLHLALSQTELVTSLRASEKKRADLLSRLVDATEDERTRIAGDLHDGPIQTLTALAFDLDFGISLVEAEEFNAATEAFRATRAILTTEVDTLREVMSDLLPPTLAERGVGLAIRDLLTTIGQRQPETSFTFTGDTATRLPEALERTFYRLAGEAVTNSIKHAGASQIDIELSVDETSVNLIVSDNGVGFDAATVDELVPSGHFGLASMQQRTEMVKGRLDISSIPGCGTHLRVTVPLAELASGTVGRNHA